MTKGQSKYFNQGYCCALAAIMKSHGESTMVKEAYECNFLTEKQLIENEVDEDDIKALLPIIKDIERTKIKI